MANWSDKNLANARAFISSCKELIASRDLSNSQLHGFLDVIYNLSATDAIKKFLQHQKRKAERAGKSREKVAEFWQDLLSRCEKIEIETKIMAGQVDPLWKNQQHRTTYVYQQLLIKFMQHTIAEKLILEKNEKKF